MSDASQQKNEEFKNIESGIKYWKTVVVLFLLLTIITSGGALIVDLKNSNSLGNIQERFGQIGDFIGGFMNPLVAFAAFCMLANSIRLQKQELAETRIELKDSRIAQQDQVKNGLLSARISALSSIVDSYNSDILNLNTEMEGINRGTPWDNGAVRARYEEEHSKRKNKIKESMIERIEKRDKYKAELVATSQQLQERIASISSV